ncbi:hypothetical protein LS633_00075 [Pseudomonas sp. NIBR-H-19]|uniref:hypothetical protein n=1 Tax=Pseudomonas sp. NIBR-H-19 TaxID=2901380 RepID=UPI001E46197E|nr:hypothetical protein [Pseudomonas sp. NIBR-H-19]UHC82275.1 hypothetical protein LS633_00075 [Pseudomonas sp. NIBR-H-19]
MPETTICHGIDGRLYEKLERLAKAAGMSPDEYAAKLGAERFFERPGQEGPERSGIYQQQGVTRRRPY